MTTLTDLDNPESLDPQQVGWKTARLAAALQHGLPVLGGLVLHASASVGHMRAGAEALETRGSGGARLVVMSRPIEEADELVARGSHLGKSLVARSSSLLEAEGRWAGAFASYVDISPEELPKAVSGCWASAFSVNALERQYAEGIEPGSFEMAVLVQTALEPTAGGVAELTGDGVFVVHGVEGSPAPLLQGWVAGHGTTHRAGEWEESPLLGIVAQPQLEALRDALARARAAFGTNRCEWATDGSDVWLLQLDSFEETAAKAPPPGPKGLDALVPMVQAVAAAPGPLGSDLVLPWALGGSPDQPTTTPEGPVDEGAIRKARELADELIGQVWGLPPADGRAKAAAALDDLLGPEPASAARSLQRLGRPDPTHVSELLGLLQAITEGMASRGVVTHPEAAWYLQPETIEAILEGAEPPSVRRIGTTSWEPLIAQVVLACGTRRSGTVASPGLGAGLMHPVGQSRGTPPPRRVLYAPQALPNLSQLLWDSSGLVTHGGSPAAHVFESTRSHGLAAVTGVELEAIEATLVAVDGFSGIVATLPAHA